MSLQQIDLPLCILILLNGVRQLFAVAKMLSPQACVEAEFRELLRALLATDPNDLIGDVFDEGQELLESMVGIGDQQDWALFPPVTLIFDQKFHDLNTDIGLTSAWGPLD